MYKKNCNAHVVVNKTTTSNKYDEYIKFKYGMKSTSRSSMFII